MSHPATLAAMSIPPAPLNKLIARITPTSAADTSPAPSHSRTDDNSYSQLAASHHTDST
jgi:hypothetical protein